MLIRWREAVSTRIIRTSAMSVRAHTGMGLRIRQRPSAAYDVGPALASAPTNVRICRGQRDQGARS